MSAVAVKPNSYVLDLADPAATLAVAGGKGSSLALMAAAGLPVPPGFSVTTTASRSFVAVGGLHDRTVASPPVIRSRATTRVRRLPASLGYFSSLPSING